jgi:ABC-type sugar transport system ATPase subunit
VVLAQWRSAWRRGAGTQLAGGRHQRVATALEPPLVPMPEPLSNVDVSLRPEVRSGIRRLHQSLGPTTVYVTRVKNRPSP